MNDFTVLTQPNGDFVVHPNDVQIIRSIPVVNNSDDHTIYKVRVGSKIVDVLVSALEAMKNTPEQIEVVVKARARIRAQ